MYALIEFAGKQFRIEEGLTLKFPYIAAKEGSKITIDKVLLLDSGKEKQFGSPYIEGIHFDAKIIEHGKENKVIVFKFKRRKGHQKKNGHKQKYTIVEVNKMKKNSSSSPTKAKTSTKETAPKKAKTSTKKTAPKKAKTSTKEDKE